MRFSRHAKNALRRSKRRGQLLSEEIVLQALEGGETIGLDIKGNRKVLVHLESVELIVVVDIGEQVVVTLWEE